MRAGGPEARKGVVDGRGSRHSVRRDAGINKRSVKQEGKMKNERMLKTAGIVCAAAAAVVFAASLTSSPRGDFEKVRPFSMELCPSSDLVKNCAAKVEGDNVKLAQFLTDFRSAVAAFNKKREAAQPEVERAFKAIDWWNSYVKTVNPFTGTYLQSPKLTTENGTTLVVWEEILNKLAEIIGNSTYVDAQSVHVCLEYLPYGSAKFKTYNTSAEDVDFVAHIKTVLAYAPEDAPVTMEGELRHRKTCVYEPLGR
jgi:hypothetical protein